MNTTRELTAAVNARRRKLYTGSPELLVHGFTDEYLERIVADEAIAREAAWQHYETARVQGSAERELAWRREVGVTFGWTAR